MIGGFNIKRGAQAELYCDTTSDVNDLPQFAQDWDLQMGSSCLCIQDSSVYMLKSDGNWKKL